MGHEISLITHLCERKERSPESILYRFLVDDVEAERLTYAGLDREARRIGSGLLRYADTGDRAVVLFPPGLDYICAFFGCLYAGILAVPIYPPTNARNSPRVSAIVADAGANIAITSRELYPKLKKLFDISYWVVLEDLPETQSEQWSMPEISSQTPAFIQYTSGSTGTPKGVIVTHGNVAHNARMSTINFGVTEKSINVSWLPPYHDMGLIGAILHPVFNGVETILMAPAAFVQRPFRWLKAVSDYRATHSGGPNFAYELCVQKISDEQAAQLNLTSWEVAFNGAEPIRAATLDAFAEKFSGTGLRKSALHPCYGLAESTLIVTGSVKGVQPKTKCVDARMLGNNRVVVVPENGGNAKRCVSSGQSIHDQSLFIVDTNTFLECRPGEIGEIWVSSQSVAGGYWGQSEDTQKTFKAELKVGDATLTCLRTGDLGFVDAGELYVTGRQKDLIILRGRNVYPQDVELVSQSSHPSLRQDGAAAFAVDYAAIEGLVVVQELEFRQKPDFSEVLAAINESLGQALDVNPHAVLLVKPGAIPRTSSGKVMRSQCRTLFIDGKLSSVAEWRREQEICNAATVKGHGAGESTWLASVRLNYATADNIGRIRSAIVENLAANLNIDADRIPPDATFASLGLSSIDAVQLTAGLEQSLGFPLSPTLAWNYPTIEELAGYLAREFASDTLSPTRIRSSTSDQIDLHVLSDDEFYLLLAKEIEYAKRLSDKVLSHE
jgi:acyl-CoA synthetase (AMP-forming)/AMP-acid ligase II/acyl carrier protein